MVKFIASGEFSYLGKIYDTKEEADRAARGIEYKSDRITGYSTAFNCEVLKYASVTKIDHEVTKEEYLDMEKEFKKEEKIFEAKIEKMRDQFVSKYESIRYAYINIHTPYNYLDTIRIVTKRQSGRKRVIEGIVCGVFITDEGEIRPSIKSHSYPIEEPILSIEILDSFEPLLEKRRVVCKNCKSFTPNQPIKINGENYYPSTGTCSKLQLTVNFYNEPDGDCYENDPKANY